MSVAATSLWDKFGTDGQNRSANSSSVARVDFVDYGKGLCIILFVMMHSTIGVGQAMGSQGWMHYAVDFSRPFRMPDFFLIAGLFLAKTIDAPWRRYLDRKVLHFAYFYIIWTAIHLTVKITTLADPSLTGLSKAFAWAMIEPGTPLWFIYVLPIFFVVTRLLKTIAWPIVFVAAAILEAFHTQEYGMTVYSFMYRFVYFYAGYRFAPYIFTFARRVAAHPATVLLVLAIWSMINALAVFKFSAAGLPLAQFPGIGLILGFSGALALISVATLLAEFGLLRFISWLGQRSIIIFVAFVLFMAPARIILVKFGHVQDVGTISLMVMLAALVGPLVLSAIVAPTPLRYLFQRPKWARLKGTQ
jgi:uncharacterized membrane protein YcfT